MKTIKLASAACLAMLTLTSTLATTAQAAATLPSILPEGTSSTNESGKTNVGSGLLSLTSAKSKGTQTETTKKLGTFDVLFENLGNILGEKCTGLGDKEAGSVLVLGTFHVRDWKKGTGKGELIPVIALLLKEVHLSCGTLLIILHGCVAGSLSSIETLTKTLTVTLNVKEKDNEIIKILNDERTAEENCELRTSTNDKEFELAALEQRSTWSKFMKGKEEVTVLVMPTP
jgi:hypothetical protein